MKVRIAISGWETYTGLLGGVPFVNGVSERDLTALELGKVGATIAVLDVETGEQVGPSTIVNGHIQAPTVRYSRDEGEQETKSIPVAEVIEEEVVDISDVHFYTKEELEEVANKGGIKAIRDIATGYDVRGVQIIQLINGILQAQTNLKAQTEHA